MAPHPCTPRVYIAKQLLGTKAARPALPISLLYASNRRHSRPRLARLWREALGKAQFGSDMSWQGGGGYVMLGNKTALRQKGSGPPIPRSHPSYLRFLAYFRLYIPLLDYSRMLAYF